MASPQVVDSLIVTLGLDPKNFDDNRKKALQAWVDMRDQSVKVGKEIEASQERVAESINKTTRSVLGLFAVLIGAHSVLDFATSITVADANLGRFAKNLDMSTQTAYAYESAAERMGGTADATASTLERMGQALYDLHRNGQMLPKEFSQLEAATGRLINTGGGVDKFMQGIAGAASQLSKTDPARAHFLLGGMGIDDATANAMIKYGDGFGAYLESIKKNAPSDQTVKNMQQLQDQMVTLQQTVVSLATVIVGNLEPALAPMIRDLTRWANANKDLITKDVLGAIQQFAVELPGMATDIKNVAGYADNVAKSLGGWGNAVNLFFDLWLGSKFIAVLTNVLKLGAAVSVATTGGAGAGIGAIGGTLAGGAAAVAGTVLALAVGAWLGSAGPAGAGEDDRMRAHHLQSWMNNTGPKARSAQAKTQADYIKEAAAARGIDPDIALRVAASEGLNSPIGDGGSSFGPFQLHYGGLSAQFPNSGLGDAFTRKTGLNAQDQSTWKQQVDFALDYASQNGWGAWSGARNQGITGKYGIGAAPHNQNVGLTAGVLRWAQMSSIQRNTQVSTNTSSSEVNINGPISVSTLATGAQGIADKLAPALKRSAMTTFANSGPA